MAQQKQQVDQSELSAVECMMLLHKKSQIKNIFKRKVIYCGCLTLARLDEVLQRRKANVSLPAWSVWERNTTYDDIVANT